MKGVSENFLRQQRLLQSGGVWKRIYLTKEGTTHDITPYLKKDGLGEITHELERDLNEFICGDVTVICFSDRFFFTPEGDGLFDDLSKEIICRIDLGFNLANDVIEYFKGWVDPQSVKRLDRRTVQFRAKDYLAKHDLYNAEEIKDTTTGQWYEQVPLKFLVRKLCEQAGVPIWGATIQVEPIDTDQRVFSYYDIYYSAYATQVCHAVAQASVPMAGGPAIIYYAGIGRRLYRVEENNYRCYVYEVFTVPPGAGNHWIDRLWWEGNYVWLVHGSNEIPEEPRAAISIWKIEAKRPPVNAQEFLLFNYCPVEGFVMDYPKLYFTQSNIQENWLKMRYCDCSTGTFYTLGSQLDGWRADRAAELDGQNRYFLRIWSPNDMKWGYFNVSTGAFTEIGHGPTSAVYHMEYHPTDDGSPRIYFSMYSGHRLYCLNLTTLAFEQLEGNTVRLLQYDPLSKELYYWPWLGSAQQLYKLRGRKSTALPNQLSSSYGCYHGPMSISKEGIFRGIVHDSRDPEPTVSRYLPFIYEDKYLPYVGSADFTDYSNREALQELAEVFRCVFMRPGQDEAIFRSRNRQGATFAIDEDLYFGDPPLKAEIWGHQYDGVIVKIDVEEGEEFHAGDTTYGKRVLTLENRFIPAELGTAVAEALLAFFNSQRRWVELEGVFLAQLELLDLLQITYQGEVISAFAYKLRYDDGTKRMKIAALEEV